MTFDATFESTGTFNAEFDTTAKFGADFNNIIIPPSYVNVSDTTAVAGDVRAGKTIHLADGSLATGSYEWDWRGNDVEMLGNMYYSKKYLSETPFATWTPSTTVLYLENSLACDQWPIDPLHYNYMLVWYFDSKLVYSPECSMKSVITRVCTQRCFNLVTTPNSFQDVESGTFNMLTSQVGPSVDFTEYYNASGTKSKGMFGSAGVRCISSVHPSYSGSWLIPRTLTVGVSCSNYLPENQVSYIIQDQSYYVLKGTLFRTAWGGLYQKLIQGIVEQYLNPLA